MAWTRLDASCRDRAWRGEGGIRTLGALLGHGALAKLCFQPLSHLTKRSDLATGRVRPTGGLAPQILDVEGFIARVEPFFQENGFYEKEIARRTEQFGNIAHVWSTYESRHHEDDPEPFMRGINSVQLFNDGKRWWIVSIYWQQESADAPIPEKYL